MSTENPTRFEDESSDPATAEAVVLGDDLEVPVPAPVLDDEPAAEAANSADSLTVRRRSIFADAEAAADETVTSEKEQTDAIPDPVTVSAPEEETRAGPLETTESTESTESTERAGAREDKPTAEPNRQDEAFTLAWTEHRPRHAAPRTEDDILLKGSTVVGKPAPRTTAHWAGILLSVVLLPFAWFFLHDSAAQVLTATEPHRFVLNVPGLVELAVGALALVLALWTARRSSLGSILVGVLALLIGIVGLAAPGVMNLHLSPVLDRLAQQSTPGANLASYVWSDAATGRLAWAGLLLIMVGVVSHSARRAGRREQEVVDQVRKNVD
ncbi:MULTISPECIES: hypothetical protein [Actinomyces]|uniref:Uncharacterized protein n=1 Tax=Actinomyces respiraculi TaxID=2744574 RepID=A0A7T0LKA5_9ACTO|nr:MULTISPECIES: hypothetical protein [Actinomyces]QPL05326.1 hypothetical protein ID810_11550 [Actinomyces respiraculi]